MSHAAEWVPESHHDLGFASRVVHRLLHFSKHLWLFYVLNGFAAFPAVAVFIFRPRLFARGMGIAWCACVATCTLLDVMRLLRHCYPDGWSLWRLTFETGGAKAIAWDTIGLICLYSAMFGVYLLDGDRELACLVIMPGLIAANSLLSVWLIASSILRRSCILLKVKTSSPFSWRQDDDTSRASQCSACVICLEAFAETEMVVKLPCEHVFHPKCIRPWLKTSSQCPYRCTADTVKHARSPDPLQVVIVTQNADEEEQAHAEDEGKDWVVPTEGEDSVECIDKLQQALIPAFDEEEQEWEKQALESRVL